MPTPPVLDLEAILPPIPGANPSGKSLAYEPAYDDLREARRVEDATLQGDWQRKPKTADWERVIDLGTELLTRESKDLQIAAWVVEALARRFGFAGLRDGFLLLRELQERFWETCYPENEDGDLEPRCGPYGFLDRVLPTLIRDLPLTSGFGEERYGYFGWQESRTTENVGLKNPELMAALIAEGKLTAKQFDDAVAQTPRVFFETLVDDLNQCAENLKGLDASLDTRFGRDAPGLVNVRRALDDCRTLLRPILETKRALEPDPEDESEEAAAETESEEAPAEEADGDEPSVAAPRRRPRPAARAASGPIADVPDAHERIRESAAYLRENDPASPVPFLAVRALRMAEVYGASDPLDAMLCEAPASPVRLALKRLMAEGEWAQLLEQAEQAISRPEGRAWLDPHRYALAAMASSDTDRTAAANACRSLLRAFLADFPSLPDAELGDGTPTASAETRAWLRDEILPQPSAAAGFPELTIPEPPPPAPAASGGADSTPDTWSTAMDLARANRAPEAIDLIRRAMSTASTGRERFHRKLELAELCLMVNRQHVALPLCEDLARQMDEFRLEEWESEALCARVWAAYYRCLRSPGAVTGTDERLRQVFARLCRLDVNQASTFASDLFDRRGS